MRVNLRRLRYVLYVYCLFDWFIGGNTAGFLPLTPLAAAQFTQVTGTVVDPNGIPYALGTITPALSFSTTPTLNGLPYSPPSSSAALDLTGHFLMNLADNTQLQPPGTKWNFLVCSAQGTILPAGGKGPVCFSLAAAITISGTSQDISSQLNAVAPALSTATIGTANSVLKGTPYYIDGVLYTNPQQIFALPGYTGAEITYPVPFGTTTTLNLGLFLQTAPINAPSGVSFTASSACAAFPYPNATSITLEYVVYDNSGNFEFSSPTTVVTPTNGGNQCITVNAPNQPFGAQNWSLVECQGVSCTGFTLQANSAFTTNFTSFSGSQNFQTTVAGSAGCATNFSCAAQIPPGDAGILLGGGTQIHLSGAGTMSTNVPFVIPTRSGVSGSGTRTTILQNSNSFPGAIAVPKVKGILSAGAGFTAGNSATVVEAFLASNGGSQQIVAVSTPWTSPSFTAANAQLTIYNPAPPLLRALRQPSTFYWVNEVVADTGCQCIQVVTVAGTSGSGGFSFSNTTINTTIADGGVTWKNQTGTIPTWTATAFATGAEVYDSVNQVFQQQIAAPCTATAGHNAFNANYAGIYTPGDGCVWQNIGLTTLYKPAFEWFVATCTTTVNTEHCGGSPLGSSLLLVTTGGANANGIHTDWSPCSFFPGQAGVCPANVPTSGLNATSSIFTAAGAGASLSAAVGPTLTNPSPAAGYRGMSAQSAGTYFAGYSCATPSGQTPMLAEASASAAVAAGQVLVITVPANFPCANAPQSTGWIPIASTTSGSGTIQNPDGVNVICGNGNPNQYVSNLQFASECGPSVTTATLILPYGAQLYLAQNASGNTISLGGMSPLQNYNGVNAFQVTFGNLELGCNSSTGSGLGATLFADYEGGIYNAAAQELNGTSGGVNVRNCLSYVYYGTGPGSQNSTVAHIQQGGPNLDYSEGVISTSGDFQRAVDDITVGPSVGGQYSMYACFHFLNPIWMSANVATFGTLSNDHAEHCYDAIEVEGGGLTIFTFTGTSGSNADSAETNMLHIRPYTAAITISGQLATNRANNNTCLIQNDVIKPDTCLNPTIQGSAVVSLYSFGLDNNSHGTASGTTISNDPKIGITFGPTIAANPAPMTFTAGADPTTAADGSVWYKNGNGMLKFQKNNLASPLAFTIPACDQSTAVTKNANSTSAQNLMSCSIPSTTLSVLNQVQHFTGGGTYSINAGGSAGTITIAATLGGVQLFSINSGANTYTVGASNIPWTFDIWCQTTATGASGTLQCYGSVNITFTASATAPTTPQLIAPVTSGTINIGSSGNTFQVTFTFSTNQAAANTVTQNQMQTQMNN